jgi:hypothetical protein
LETRSLARPKGLCPARGAESSNMFQHSDRERRPTRNHLFKPGLAAFFEEPTYLV